MKNPVHSHQANPKDHRVFSKIRHTRDRGIGGLPTQGARVLSQTLPAWSKGGKGLRGPAPLANMLASKMCLLWSIGACSSCLLVGKCFVQENSVPAKKTCFSSCCTSSCSKVCFLLQLFSYFSQIKFFFLMKGGGLSVPCFGGREGLRVHSCQLPALTETEGLGVGDLANSNSQCTLNVSIITALQKQATAFR